MPRLPHLFNFILRPIEDITPWGGAGDLNLHWFGLTDGWYWMNAGGVELMRYSQALIDATPEWGWAQPYMDYQVSRFYEDLMYLLPYAIDPIPSDVLDLVRTPEREAALEDQAYAWSDRHWEPMPYPQPPTPAQLEAFIRRSAMWDRALGWWTEKRRLSRGHAAGLPDIQMWREGDTVSIRWTDDCGGHADTGIPWIGVGHGVYSLAFAEFMDEVHGFHERFMHEMGARVETARTAWPRPGVAIDVPGLVDEHRRRSESLAQALTEAETTRMDWGSVREAIAEVELLVADPSAVPRHFAWQDDPGERAAFIDGPRPKLVTNPHHARPLDP